ncbi:hypothetical protein ERO13_A10G243600v2 [Gossypium hirsutum]|nr:hypothetical protein ERO13_A10G243600v2 [Gossypium hirsutum]
MKNPENAEGWRLLGITHAENDDDQQVGEQSSTCKIVVNGLREGWKTEEPNLVGFLKQLHLTNPLILTFSGSPRNPQIVSFLELLDLPYVFDNASDSRDSPPSLPQKDDYSEDIPNEDKDDLEDDAERM